MSVYMSRLFPKSNSSFLVSSGQALKSQVSRITDEMFVVDSGLGAPKMCMKDDLTRVPTNGAISFENKVGAMALVAGETLVKKQLLERCFMDLVVGDEQMRERATGRFNDLVGSTEVVPGEPHILLPRRFRQHQAWMELNKIWRTNRKVRGFLVEKVRGGYSVAIAGYIAFLPFRPPIRRGMLKDEFTIESINPKRKRIVVF